MRIPPHSVALAATVAATLALPGCAQEPPPIIPTAQPTSAPVFRSDAEALAAAKEAYTGYLAASDQIGNDGGSNPERIAPWVTRSRIAAEILQFDSLAKAGQHFTGSSKFANFRLQQLSQSADGIVLVVAYVCDDVTSSRVVDATGEDITPSTRKDVMPIQVRFRNESPGSAKLLVEGSAEWVGSDICSR